MKIDEIIRSYCPMSDKTIALLRQHLKEAHFKKRSLLIRQGEVNMNLYIVKSGVLRCFVKNGDKEHTRWFADEGDFFASMFSFHKGEPSNTNVEALSDVDAYIIDGEVFNKLIRESHELAVWSYEYLLNNMFTLERRFSIIGAEDAYTRYSNLFKLRGKEFLNLIPLQHISTYLNITPQTLSRVRRKFAYEGKHDSENGKADNAEGE